MFYRMSSGTSLLGSSHVLRSFHCRFECLPRRHRAMQVRWLSIGHHHWYYSFLQIFMNSRVLSNIIQDIFEFSAAFPRKSAFDLSWEEYVDRTVAWCDRLVADTAPLRFVMEFQVFIDWKWKSLKVVHEMILHFSAFEGERRRRTEFPSVGWLTVEAVAVIAMGTEA